MDRPGPEGGPEAPPRLGPRDVLLLAAWCGLAAGELEVAARVGVRAFGTTQRLYLMTRHFVWLIPAINLALFIGVGTLLAAASRRWPRRAGWWGPRLTVTFALLPPLSVAGRLIYLEAWLLVAAGLAIRLVPTLERQPGRWRARMVRSLPLLAGLVLIQALAIVGGDRIKRWREEGRPLPPDGSPDVLLVVLDTVRADHLSLYGYPRPTTPNLERLARRGIRFDRARAAAPWTLASHAAMFTGRRPHELGVDWTVPLRGGAPMLAEYLGSLGYATAGFVGNTFYASYDTGLDRGFAHYEDYVVDPLAAARTVKSLGELLRAIAELGRYVGISGRTYFRLTTGGRKDAGVVNREFLDWLSRRRGPRRPYFAFLNYVDAHSPYLLPEGAPEALGTVPMTEADRRFLAVGWNDAARRRFPRASRRLVRDAYDDCLAYLDARLGELMDELGRRGAPGRTLVIIASDHGEELGDHDLFEHGESLYRPEVRVPLLILPPEGRGSSAAPAVVDAWVSLRDIAATVAEFVRPGRESPLPGRSLLRSGRGGEEDAVVLSELATPNPSDPNGGRSPARRGPLTSLAEGDYVYIRNEGDGGEELFREGDDPQERSNLARDAGMTPVLSRFRDRLGRVRASARAAGEADRVAAGSIPSAP